MALRDRIKQIASSAVRGYISTMTDINTNSFNNNAGAVQIGLITQVTQDGQYTVMFSDGSTQNVTPAGIRIVGPGDTVLVGAGTILG